MKLRLKGKEGDPYTDSIVDIPLEQVDVSRAIGNDLQGGIRRAVQRNAKYTTRKKDPESGKLISYSDYVSKYGDPEESGGDDNFGNTSW